MCDGMHFCGPCLDEKVEAWAHGELHELPKFGDDAQRRTAARMRLGCIRELVASGRQDELMAFPEWTWSQGISHERPGFADDSARYTFFFEPSLREEMVASRRGIIDSLLRQGNLVTLQEFPEFLHITTWLGMESCSDMTTFLRSVPKLRNPPRGKEGRKRYRIWMENWEAPFSGAYHYFRRQLLDTVGCRFTVGARAFQVRRNRTGWNMVPKLNLPVSPSATAREPEPELVGA